MFYQIENPTDDGFVDFALIIPTFEKGLCAVAQPWLSKGEKIAQRCKRGAP